MRNSVFFVSLFLVMVMGFHTGVFAHTDVEPSEAKTMIDTNDQLIIVDVRETESEYCDEDPTPPVPPGHIPGALNYPWSSGVLAERYQELLPLDQEILVVCRSGSRSNAAAEFLDSQGFINIYDMTGGMREWVWETVVCVDSDSDGINDDLDNCPGEYNPNQEDVDCDGVGDACDPSIDCTEDVDCDNDCDGVYNQDDICPNIPDPGQEDTYPPGGNGIGDACECEGNFDCDGDQDGTDAAVFKINFGRSGFNNPCTYDNPCYGDFDADGDADGSDAAKFKEDFGRSGFSNPCPACDKPIGVLLVVHGGMDTYEDQYMWDSSVHQFSYDHNHSVYKFVIWNPTYWPLVLDPTFTDYAVRFIRMYDFEYDRIGGMDPFHGITDQQLLDLKTELDANPYGLTFEVDWAGYMAADCVEHYAYPRFIYYGPNGLPDPDPVYPDCKYCGEDDPGGAWPGCDPERYNVDGPVERLIKKGAYRIIVIDWTMGGPRFSKTFDVVEMSKRALDDWQANYGLKVPLTWVNDYSNLMERSYPIEPEGWTRILKNPTVDSHVLLNGSPNPVAADSVVVDMHVDVIEDAFSPTVSDADTAVLLFNHALHDYNEWFDPKINDTLIINKGIKTELLARRPTMDPDNIVGAFGGIQEVNPANGLEERNRDMRGESYGHAWLYQTAKVLPGDEWGYRYWDALEYLKNRGVQHIVISFPQVVTDSALNMVEVVNQVAGREIGYKNWLQWGIGDYDRYPTEGHPFPDYWGIWVNTGCGEWDLAYDSGTAAFSAGATLTGDSSSATGVIKWFSGDTTSGTLVLKELTGTFQAGELITDSKGGSASANGVEDMTSKPECCFEMGGCGDPLRPYPPVRQTPLNVAMSDLDPNLCFDMSEYGHRGYDPLVGPPDPDNPVQDQYTGTWEMYTPPNDDPRVGEMLAGHVLNAIIKPMVYITNGEVEGITEGGSVTFDAHVETGGKPPYTYAWSTNKDDAGWISQGTGSSWTFNTTGGDAGTYSVRCIVADSQSETGEVIWEGFQVSTP